MKKLLLSLTLFASLLLFTGCPFNSDVAIDAPSIRVNEKLLGTWEPKSSTEYIYNVTKTDNFTYKFDKKTKSSGDITTYFGFVSDVSGTKYMNIYEDGAGTKNYYLYKFEQTGEAVAKLTAVTENIDEKFATSAELKAFLAKNQNLSFLFDKDEDAYYKIK